MIVLGKNEIMSRECTNKGDNLAMSFHAIGTPLLRSLKIKCPDVKHISLADVVDAGKVKNLKIWWDKLVSQGQKDVYYVDVKKS